PYRNEGRENLSKRVGNCSPPLSFGRKAAVGAGNAAQQAARRRLERRIGGFSAGSIIQRALGDGIEVCFATGQTGEVDAIPDFAAQNRTVKNVVVVDHRVDDRNLTLRVRMQKPN